MAVKVCFRASAAVFISLKAQNDAVTTTAAANIKNKLTTTNGGKYLLW